MCLILLAHDNHPEYRLILGANRDEMHARPASPLHEWSDMPGVYGGRDLQAGGSWLAVSAKGRWAAVTNYRDPTAEPAPPGAPSRGELVSAFVAGSESPAAYLDSLTEKAALFAGFNLLVGDGVDCAWLSNRAVPLRYERVSRGVHGLSNHLLDTPWPKVERGKAALTALSGAGSIDPEDLLSLLLDRTLAADHDLPATGVPLELERALSAAFISTPGYGTRCSTALLIRRNGSILMAERNFGAGGEVTGETRLEL